MKPFARMGTATVRPMARSAHPARRRTASLAALVAATLVLTGCFRAEFEFNIDDDGTADVVVLTAIDTEQFEELGRLLGEDTAGLGDLSGEDLFAELTQGDDPCGDLTGELAEYETEVEQINEGSEVGVRCTVFDVPIEELTELGDASSLRIEQDDDGTRFEATLEGVDELTGGTEGLDLGAIPGFDLDDIFSIRFTVSAPGSIGDNNATSTSGSTATWVITADAGFVENGDAVMRAEWTPGGSGSNTWMIVAGILALLAVAVAVFFVLRSRSATPAAAEASGNATAAATPPPPPGSSPPPPPPTPTAPPSLTAPPSPSGDSATSPPPPPSTPPPPPPPQP